MDSLMEVKQATVRKKMINQTTNGVGVIAGLPQLMQGIPLLIAGDFINGSILTAQGLALLVGFYLVGK